MCVLIVRELNMKRSTRNKAKSTKLNSKQRSTLELWQDHLTALRRASQAKPTEADTESTAVVAKENSKAATSENSVDPESRPTLLS